MIRMRIAAIGVSSLLAAGLLAGCSGSPSSASAPTVATPETPSVLNAAPFQRPILKLRGVGVQIYTCRANQGPQGYAWELKAPESSLLDEHGVTIGRNSAGPTWELNDGSRVVGRVQESLASPDGNAIPWLRLAVVQNAGAGALAAVRAIQRVETVGGMAPASGCEADTRDSEVRVDYAATYYFYVDTA